VADYWRGMATYYMVFALFCGVTLVLRQWVVDPEATTMVRLLGLAVLTYPLLIVIYFLALFAATQGMKHFVARKPGIYKWLKVISDK
jgi:hypothetical protein